MYIYIPCCVLLALLWNTNENPRTDKLSMSRAIKEYLKHDTVEVHLVSPGEVECYRWKWTRSDRHSGCRGEMSEPPKQLPVLWPVVVEQLVQQSAHYLATIPPFSQSCCVSRQHKAQRHRNHDVFDVSFKGDNVQDVARWNLGPPKQPPVFCPVVTQVHVVTSRFPCCCFLVYLTGVFMEHGMSNYSQQK